MSQLKYLLYVRKSSESEDRQVLSMLAQVHELRVLVERRGLQVIGDPIEEAMSAKQPGRPKFGAVLRELSELGAAENPHGITQDSIPTSAGS